MQHPRAETALGIARTLAKADGPAGYVGGVLLAQASEKMREFVECMGLTVAHSLMGKGALRDDRPLVISVTGIWGLIWSIGLA